MTDMAHTAMRKLTIKTQASENGSALHLFIVLHGIAMQGRMRIENRRAATPENRTARRRLRF
jgi:hypothetical protein